MRPALVAFARRIAQIAGLMAAVVILSGCHPGNAEAKDLRAACGSGDFAACNALAEKMQKGEYVLRDDAGAAAPFEQSCAGGVGEACARLGVIYQRVRGVKRDSARAAACGRRRQTRGPVRLSNECIHHGGRPCPTHRRR
jgi:hypothetical protein